MIIGKNTQILKAIKWLTVSPPENDPNFQFRSKITLMPHLTNLAELLKLNVGIIFTNSNYHTLRALIESEVTETEAVAGVLAPCNVSLPAGPTFAHPSNMELFFRLNLSIKIVNGAI